MYSSSESLHITEPVSSQDTLDGVDTGHDLVDGEQGIEINFTSAPDEHEMALEDALSNVPAVPQTPDDMLLKPKFPDSNATSAASLKVCGPLKHLVSPHVSKGLWCSVHLTLPKSYSSLDWYWILD